ncbi:MAG: signal peptidase I [Cellulosilyticaceae bacterium]
MRRGKIEFWKKIKEISKEIAIVVAVVILINTFVIQSHQVKGNSMLPTLKENDLIIMNKWIYNFQKPTYNEIIGFYAENLNKKIVKRIVGLPGDVINIKDGIMYCNDEPIRVYSDDDILGGGNIQYPITILEDMYFVIGDNYNNSTDSRHKDIGLIETKQILGRINIRLWPLTDGLILKD